MSVFEAAAIRDLILTMTYGVVVFSILVQGLTLGRLAARSRAAVDGRQMVPGVAIRSADR